MDELIEKKNPETWSKMAIIGQNRKISRKPEKG
jgi:hypothetical protein